MAQAHRRLGCSNALRRPIRASVRRPSPRALGIQLAHLRQDAGHAADFEVLHGDGLGEGTGVGVAELFAHVASGPAARASHPSP